MPSFNRHHSLLPPKLGSIVLFEEVVFELWLRLRDFFNKPRVGRFYLKKTFTGNDDLLQETNENGRFLEIWCLGRSSMTARNMSSALREVVDRSEGF